MDSAIFRSKLNLRREELTKRLHKIENDLDQPTNADVEERSVEREDDEMLENLGQSGLEEIKHIDLALSRIDAGTYGICATCKEPISIARLEAVPTALLCRNCAS
ncbi:MAG: TraR/DksA family transcriptional regulator [Hyphomicrobiales bacterium]